MCCESADSKIFCGFCMICTCVLCPCGAFLTYLGIRQDNKDFKENKGFWSDSKFETGSKF